MSYTLVLVGGTGQRFGLALGYLNLLGACTMPSQVVVIDAEGAGSAENRVTRQMRALLQFAEPEMRFVEQLPFRASGDGVDATIHSCIPRLRESAMFPLCFSEVEERTTIAQGFYAMPKLASVVYHAQLAQKPREVEGAFEHVSQPDGARRVIVVGSVSGGTGAGILREVARRFRAERANQVIGIVFTRYLNLPASANGPKNDDLDTNSRIGTGFLLDDVASPFDLITFVGTPDRQPDSEALDASQSGLPHPFLGLLLACTLVTDGGDAYWERRAQIRLNERADRDADVKPRHAFTVRKGSISLTQDDVYFPLRATEAGKAKRYLRLSDAREAAALASAELERWREDYPFASAVDGWSLFVRRKLTPALHDTFAKARGTDRASRGDLEKTWKALAGDGQAIDSARAGLADFGHWLAMMSGSLEARDGTNARRKSWKEAIRVGTGHIAQGFCRDVGRAQWQAVALPEAKAHEPVYLYPYQSAASGRVSIGMVEEIMQAPAIRRVRDESYATPLARALAFERQLAEGDLSARQTSHGLWCGVALGWLSLRVDDLRTGSEFERYVVAMDSEEQARFTGILAIADVPGLPEALHRHRGQVVGATHWSCGFWPGVRKEALSTLAALNHALGQPERELARGVLARWRDDLLIDHAAAALRGQRWYDELERIVADNGVALPRPDYRGLRTIGPVRLSVEGRAAKLASFYFYTLEGNRAARLGDILQQLGSQAAAALDQEELQVNQARVRVQRRVVRDSDHQIDVASTIAGGFLNVDVVGLPKPSHIDTDMVLQGLGKLSVPGEVSAGWGMNGRPSLRRPGPRLPDVFWERSFEWDVEANDEYVELPLPADGAGPVSADNIAPSLKGVLGIYFHPARRKWIVWLKDDVYCPAGEDIVQESPTRVRIRRGRRVWLVSFPRDGVTMLKPESVLLPELVLLKQENAADIAPALAVRREFLDLVLCDEDTKPAAMLDGSTYVFRFRLVGGVELRVLRGTQSAISQPQLQIAVWPNLASAAWRRFWLTVESDRASATALDVRVYRRSEHGFFEEIVDRTERVVGTSRFVSVLGRPRLVWLGATGKTPHGGSFAVLGAEERAASGETATVAIDFGTFRTAASVQVGPMPESTPMPPDFKPLAVTLVSNPSHTQAARHNLLLPTLAAGAAAATAPMSGACAKLIVPSILVTPRRGADDTHPFLRSDSTPFVDYGIPMTGVSDSPSLTEFPDSAGQNLKWGGTTEERAGRQAFLRSVVLLAAAEGYKRGATRLEVGFTYPLAYDDPAVLSTSMQQAVDWLNHNVLTPGRSVLLPPMSESAAGMREARVAGAGWILSLDLGGGTLDLALFNGDQTNAKVLARDSVRLGGNLVTTSYAARTKTTDRDLRWHISSGKSWVGDNQRDVLTREVDRLFVLALEYAARFVAGTARAVGDPAVKVGVVLLGSGWRWHAAGRAGAEFDRHRFGRDYELRLRSRLEELSKGKVQLDGINTRVLDTQFEKLAVSMGLLRLQPEKQPDGSGIRAPNGLTDDGCRWDTLVGPDSEGHADQPGRLEADPAFDAELEQRAPLKQHLSPAALSGNGILRTLRDAWEPTFRRRKRTALGVVFDQLATDEWFKT